jgi:putative membrane protein
VPVAIGALFDVLGDLRLVPDAPDEPGRVGGLAGGLSIAFGLAIWVGIGAVVGIVRHYGFTVERRSADELAIRRGLLERRTSVVPLRRVLRAEVHANPLRRVFGLVRVEVSTAASGGEDGSGDLHPGVPVLRRSSLSDVLELFLAGAGREPSWRTHPPAARRRAIARRLMLLAAPGAVVGLQAGSVAVWAALALAVPVLAAVWGVVWYRMLAHDVLGDLLHVRSGALLFRRSVVLLAKVQSVKVVSSPFQRRAGLVSVQVDLVGGMVTVRDVAEADGTVLARLVRTRAGG